MLQWAPFICAIALASADPSLPEWERPGRCGTNCLYVYLKICGHRDASYDDVASTVPIQEGRGTSLSDLANAANRLGVDMAPFRVQDSEIGSIPLPFIAHLDPLDIGGAGHFITVFKIESDGTVRYIDGSSGIQTARSLSQLRPVLTGDVLARPTGSLGSRSALPIVAGGFSLGALVGALALAKRSASP